MLSIERDAHEYSVPEHLEIFHLRVMSKEGFFGTRLRVSLYDSLLFNPLTPIAIPLPISQHCCAMSLQR
jgi:hypothetical protein